MQSLLAFMVVMVTTATSPLAPCPPSPNCVSSQAADKHYIEPFPFIGEAQVAFGRLKQILAARGDTTMVAADDRELRVEFRTTLGFVDDGHFILDLDKGCIQIRSASRAGYWDFGKNRRRLEEIRRELEAGEN